MAKQLKNIFETNPETFVRNLEDAIKDGWQVCYDEKAPSIYGYSMSVWLEKEVEEVSVEIVPTKTVGRPPKSK